MTSSLILGATVGDLVTQVAASIAAGNQPTDGLFFAGSIPGQRMDTGTDVDSYSVVTSDTVSGLTAAVAAAITAGQQPLSQFFKRGNLFYVTMVDNGGAITAYDVVYGDNYTTLNAAIATSGKNVYGEPVRDGNLLLQQVITGTPAGGGGDGEGATIGDTIIGYSGEGYQGFTNIILEASPAPEVYPWIGRVEPPYETAFIGTQNVQCFDVGEVLIGTGVTSVVDGLLVAVNGLDIPPPPTHDVELDEDDTWNVRNWAQAGASAIEITVSEDDGEFFGRFPEDAVPIKHGAELLNDPGLTANVQAGILSEITGAVIIAKDGDGPILIENTAGGKSIQGTAVASTISGVGGPGVRIDTPYNVVQSGDSLPITKLDGTTSLGASANCGFGAGGNAVARLFGAQAVLEDQDEVVIGATTYTFTIVDNVITAIDTA